MTRRSFYWIWGTLYLIVQVGYFYFSFIAPDTALDFVSLIGSTVLTAIFIAVVLSQTWPPKNTTRRMVYGFGAVLFVVLEADFFISAPLSALGLASLIGSAALVAAYVADQTIQNWPQIWAVIKKLRRPPIE